MRRWRVEWTYAALTALLVTALWWFPARGQLETDSYSVSTGGRKALFQVLRKLEEDVSRSTERLIPRPGEMDRLLILGPARYPNASEWDELQSEVMEGGTIFLAASAEDPKFKTDEFGVSVERLIDGRQKSPVAPPEGDSPKENSPEKQEPATDEAKKADGDEKSVGDAFIDLLSRLQMSTLPATTTLNLPSPVQWTSNARLQFTNESEWEVLLKTEQGPQVARRQWGTGTVVFCATDAVFSNESLLDAQQALLAYRLLEACPVVEKTWVDETLNGSGVPKILGMLLDPLFRPLTLQCALLAVLFGWLGARRFGPAVEIDRGRRRSIVEHAEALGILYYRAHAGSRAVQSLREYFRLEVRRLCGSTFKQNDINGLARQTRTEEAAVRDTLDRATAAEVGDFTNAEASRTLRDLSGLIAALRKRA